MITLTRSQVRRLRQVFRRSVLGIHHRGILAPLALRAEGGQLRAQHRYCDLAVEHVEPGSYRPVTSIAIPLDALADFEGAGDAPVVLESVGPDRTVVRWEDRGIPQSREYDVVTAVDRLDTMPELPTSWTSNPGELLTALAEAAETGDPDSQRYSLGCIQLQGAGGQIVATDGRQALIQSGFRFAWGADLLINGRPVFACRALPREQPVEIGTTDTHVVLRCGDWTVWCEIQKEARFPAVERALPGEAEVVTRLRLDPEDVRFLGPALGRLPGASEHNSPVTVDLNGAVALRFAASELPNQVTELGLSRSSCTGSAVSIVFNRTFLERALRLGFTEIGFSGVDSPLVCRNQRTIYVVQPLTGGTPLKPDDIVARIESGPATSRDRSVQTHSETQRRPMSERASKNHARSVDPSPTSWHVGSPRPNTSNGHVGSAVAAETNGHSGAENSGTSLAALIQETEALYAVLGDAKSKTARLIAGLRRHRKHSRLVQETLKSLRQLKLADAVE